MAEVKNSGNSCMICSLDGDDNARGFKQGVSAICFMILLFSFYGLFIEKQQTMHVMLQKKRLIMYLKNCITCGLIVQSLVYLLNHLTTMRCPITFLLGIMYRNEGHLIIQF